MQQCPSDAHWVVFAPKTVEPWDVLTNSGATNFAKWNDIGSTLAGATVGTAEQEKDTEEYEMGGERKCLVCAVCMHR